MTKSNVSNKHNTKKSVSYTETLFSCSQIGGMHCTGTVPHGMPSSVFTCSLMPEALRETGTRPHNSRSISQENDFFSGE